MAKTPEAKVKAKVKAILKSYGAYHFMPIGGPYSAAGVPDIIACYKGRFIGIECKAGNNKPTALQRKHLDEIGNRGGVAMVINENNIDDVDKCLSKM